MSRVPQVDDVFIWKLIDDGTRNRKPTQARVENTNRRVIHTMKLTRFTLEMH